MAIFYDSPNRQIKVLAKFSGYTIYCRFSYTDDIVILCLLVYESAFLFHFRFAVNAVAYHFVKMMKLNCSVIVAVFACVLQPCLAQDTHYVSAATGVCDDGLVPCATLSEYTKMARNNTSNITLVLLSGRHLLTGSNFEVSDSVSFTMVADFGSVEVECSPPLRFVFTDIMYVSVSTVDFISCGVDVTSVLHFEVSDCKFQDGHSGSAIRILSSGFAEMKGNSFTNNSATNGGAVYMESFAGTSVINLENNSFIGNSASVNGGAIWMVLVSATFTGTHFFEQNSAASCGGAIFMESSNLTFGTSVFVGNLANEGGALFSNSSSGIFAEKSLFLQNAASLFGGAIFSGDNSSTNFEGDAEFAENKAEIGGGIATITSVTLSFNDVVFKNNIGLFGGGMVLGFSSSASFRGNTRISENRANFGGGFIARSSVLHMMGHTVIDMNVAFRGGGGVIVDSNLFVSRSLSFVENYASGSGGGCYLTGSSSLLFNPLSFVTFTNNTAQLGGAIAVEDSIDYLYCSQDISLVPGTDCFYQLPPENLSPFSPNASLLFDGNSATVAGGDIFGGAVDACFVLNSETLPVLGRDSFDLLTAASEGDLSISSEPIRVCVCDHGVPDCNKTRLHREMFPGSTMRIEAITLGQRNGNVPGLIRSVVTSDSAGSILNLEKAQQTSNVCTNLTYTVFIEEELTVDIDLYPEGPCPSSVGNISISISFLSCPVGFEFSPSEQACICDARLVDIDSTIVCDISNLTIQRNSNFWIGFDDERGLIVQSHCPFDYCISEAISVPINNSDVQCNGNRAGILCGRCRENFSLSIGSLQCRQCSNAYLALLFLFVLAGIALVATLFVLKLTVVEGTLSGLAFYANIVGYNTTLFFPPDRFNILRVFLAWFNLDFGIETCFFDGMDNYSSAWLQFAFPMYIWLLAGGIIVVSHFHARVAKMLGSNPISVLATLFLLSFTKILSATAQALYSAVLRYPDNVEVVWEFDGNIRYFSGKHIPLALFALGILLVIVIPYAFLLFLQPWIQKYRICGWINRPRIKSFFDVYYAPYNNKHRYWIGLLLILRCIIFLMFQFNTELENSGYFTVTVVCLCLTALLNTGIYKKWYLDLLETSFIVNLGALAAATGYVSNPTAQTAIVSISVGIAAIEFIGIVVYHILLRIGIESPSAKIISAITNLKKKDKPSEEGDPTPENDTSKRTYTMTEVSLSSLNFSQLREPVLDYVSTEV